MLIAAGTGGGTVAGVSGKSIYMIKAYADGADGTVAFNGQTITIRSDVGWDIDFRGQVTASTSVVFSGSIDYLIVWAS
jgi:hypothetical protein